MEKENKKNNKKVLEDSSIQNDDLMIMPNNGAESKKEAAATSVDSTQKQASAIKVVKKKKKKTFDMDLNVIKQKQALQKNQKPVIKDEAKSLKLFNFVIKEPKSLLVEVIKNGLVFILSLGIFTFSLYIESVITLAADKDFEDAFAINIPQNQSITVQTAGVEAEVRNIYEIVGGEIINTKESSPVVISLKDNGLLRLDKDTEIKIIDENNIRLINGKIWGNMLYNFFDLKINTDYISLKPGVSSFEINFDGSSTNIFSHKHDLTVDILADGIAVNTLWIAEGNKASFSSTKIAQAKEKIEQLLYSKLIKEFNYGRQSQSNYTEDNWIAFNIEEDKNYYVSTDQAFTKKIRDEGLKNLSTESLRFQTKQLIDDLRKTFTFSDTKKAYTALNSIFENVHDASYLYLQDENVSANVRLTLFKEDISDPDLSLNPTFTEMLDKQLVQTFNDYVYLDPGHKLYPVKKFLLEEYFKKNKEFPILTLKINEVYDSVVSTPKDSNRLIAEYFEWYQQLINKHKNNLSEIQDEIIQQNILVDNLIIRNPEIYKLETFELKRGMEDDYLATLSSSRDKREQRQTFINEKINILAKIETFLFAEQLDPVDARQIVFRLITDIEELKENTLDIAAVNELFDRRLKDFGVFWEYLKSDEYSTTKLHGASHEDRFETFKSLQDKELSFEDIRIEILGTQEVEETTATQILNDVKADLNELEIEQIRFGTYVDTSKKVPILSAFVSGIEFRATYDWERMLLGNIVVEDELISAEGLKVKNARKFIIEWHNNKYKATEVEEEEEEDDEYEDVKKVARVFVVDKLQEAGILLEESNVSIKDLNAGLYEISNVNFEGKNQIKFDFEYLSKEEKAKNVLIHTRNGDKLVENTFVLVFLDDIVFKIYDEES
ncbi:hypothetical protein ACFL3T_01805 [Patescibacteria group bacterium]